MINYFGERRTIFNIHFRNIHGRRDDFQETFPDEGDMGMVAVMRSLKRVGYSFMVMPDHLPQHADDPQGDQAFAFGYGYIKALLQAVGPAILSISRYTDRYVEQNGEWRIQRREITIEFGNGALGKQLGFGG